MPSLVNTLLKWYLTVRGLMNNRVPISGLERPSRASRAIRASWAVSSPAGLDGALAGGLTGGPQLAPGPGVAWARCQARRSGSSSRSVASARAPCTSWRSCGDAAR